MDASEVWQVKSGLPSGAFEYIKMIHTILLEVFPINIELQSKPLVLVHSRFASQHYTHLINLNLFLFFKIKVTPVTDVVYLLHQFY